MFCPYYKNKEVADGFNEIVTALGGKPLTEEEFKSSALRKQREGLDYSAMEAAYTVYDRNGGNFLDKTPTGEDSILFQTLLDYFEGDRKKAIVAKSNVYSDEFINWFGDWGRFKTMDTKNNLFTPTGEVNWNYFEQLLDQYHNNQPDSMFSHGRYTLATRPENHFTGEKNTLNHIKFVTQSMLNLLEGKYDIDLPFVSEARASMQNQKDLMIIAAMFHDAAKPYRHGDIHGWESADILRDLLGVDYDNRVAEWAVRHHMPMPFSHKAEFSLSNPEAIEVAKNIARDARRVGIDANTAINAFVLINAADVINGRELNVDDNWAKKAGKEGLKKYNGDISVKNVLSIELKEKVALLKKAFDEIKDEDFGDTAYNYSHQERFNYQAFPEGGREDKKLPYLNNTEYTGVSKVVDQNGEPLVVWHGTLLQEFYFKDGNPYTKNVPKFDTFKSGFFTNDYEAALSFANGNISKMYAVYLNIKTPGIVDAEGNDFENVPYKRENKRTDYVAYDINNNGVNDGTIITNVSGENWGRVKNLITDYIPANPNQIKHVKNLGTWNPNNPNIYHITAKPNTLEHKIGSVSLDTFFLKNDLDQLYAGKFVSTSSIIQHLLKTGSFSEYNIEFAEIASKHEIPVIFQTLPAGKPMSTVELDGKVYIEIDPEQIINYRTETASEYILHEIVHALSVKALRNPNTQEESEFRTATFKLYTMLDKLMPETEWDRSSIDSGGYILADVYEFAAVFATDKDAKYMLYQRAIEQDKLGNNKLFLRLKQFINALFRLILNKNVFKNVASDQLKLYEKNLTKYLLTKKLTRTDVDSVEYLNKLLETENQVDINNEHIAILRENLTRRYANFIRHYITTASAPGETDATKHEKLWLSRIRIAEALETRLAAINSSTIGDDLKLKSGQIIESQIKQFNSKQIPTIVALQSFLQETLPQLLDDVEQVRHMNQSSHTFYMYNMHDNFGAYAAIFNMLSRDVQNKQYLEELDEEFKNLSELDKLAVVKNIDDFVSVINSAAATANEGVNYMFNILMNNVRKDLEGLADEINFSNTKEFLDSIDVIGFDTNRFIDIFGSKDGARDPLIRSIVYLVNKALYKTKKEVQPVATKLLKLKDQLRPGESILDLYELDDEGKTTQFLVRQLNFGKFYKDYREFQERLNEKYNLPKGNRNAPEDQDTRKKYNLEKNKWLSEHCERRFVSKYYEAYAELSDDTMERLNAIRNAISTIKRHALDESTGLYHYDKLTDEQWKRLQGLYIEKRLLASDYTLYGDLKIEGSDAYRIAKELQKLNETLYGKTEKEIKLATDKWQAARNEVIRKAVEDNTVDGNTNYLAVNKIIEKWDERNSKRVFKKDGEDTIIFKQIEQETEAEVGFSKPVYELDGDGGAKYEANKKRINETINNFRDYNTGEPNLDIMPARVKSVIKELELENKEIKKKARANDAVLRKRSKIWDKAYRRNFNKYLHSEYTRYYRKSVRSYADEYITNSDEDRRRIKKRWETILKVNADIDEARFVDIIPGDGWIDRDENNSLLNPVYAKMNINTPYIPKAVLEDGSKPYDNSVQYNKIMNSPTLKALYQAIVGNKETGEEGFLQIAHKKQFNRLYQDDYLLPGVTGSMWKYMKNQGLLGAVSAAVQYTGDHLGFTAQGIQQDQNFGSSISNALGKLTDLQEIVSLDNSLFGGKATGVRPDGRTFSIIPQYYNNRLDDPSQLSSDLIGIICAYYENACNFQNKSEIKDEIESIVDVIENRRYQIINENTGNYEVKQGQTTTTFKAARDFVEMNLYNIRASSTNIGPLNLGKTAQNFSRLTQALNLGMSPAVALTGFFTAQYSHLINAIVGDRGYGMREYTQAAGEVIGHYIRTYAGIQYASNQLSDDKIMLLAEKFDVSNQLKRKFKNSNRSRFVRFIDNWCFGMLTSTDFATKSTIMVANLMSYRLLNGKFMTKEDVLNMLEASTEEGEKRLLEQWEKGKVLYSIFSVKNKELVIDPEYKEAFDKVENLVYHRINKTAENADGMATETQKAAITTNFFGAAVLTHRQYLPLMIQQRFLPMVYDFDMQMYTQGQYVVDWQFFKNVCWQAIKELIKAKSVQNAIDVFKEEYQKFTHDTSTEESWKISRARKKALKKTITELTVFTTVVIPLVSLICMFADDDDNKDELALQLAAYIARRTQWEVFTPYRMSDIFNNIKSVSAQTGTLDKLESLSNTVSRRIFPQGFLLDTLLGLDKKTPMSDIIQKGVYEGHSKLYKALMQLTPYHNLYEQWYGSRQKRKYYEKQIMKMDD